MIGLFHTARGALGHQALPFVTDYRVNSVMTKNGVRALAALAVCTIAMIPAFAQRQKDPVAAHYGDCGAANGGGPNSTNYYGSGNPCAFTYSVPAERINDLLNEVPYCTMYSRTQVNCSKALKGNYGQLQLDRRDGAGAGGGKNPGSAAELSYSDAPPHGVAPEQRALAEQLWTRAAALIDRNDHRGAMPLLLQAGRMGHARAQATLGIAYQDGHGVKADDKAAAHWFGLAAAQGHRAAQYALAGMFEEGDGGLPKNIAKARELYSLSANQGFDKAQMVMGIAYEFGRGVPRSRPKAIALLRQSGEGRSVADVLANPRTPARFADESVFANYLAKLRNAEIAASWARAAAQLGSGGNEDWKSSMGNILYRQWQASGGGGDPRNNGPAPLH